MAFQSRPDLVQWYDSSSLLLPSLVPLAVPLSTSLHCLNLSHPLVPHFSFFPPVHFLGCLAAHAEPDCSTFPELIGVTLAWQETQSYYGNAQSITGQGINTLSVISDYHICVGLMVAMHGCYLLDGVLSASPGGTQAYVWGLRHCWSYAGSACMRAFPLQTKHLHENFSSHSPAVRDNGVIMFHVHVIELHYWC